MPWNSRLTIMIGCFHSVKYMTIPDTVTGSRPGPRHGSHVPYGPFPAAVSQIIPAASPWPRLRRGCWGLHIPFCPAAHSGRDQGSKPCKIHVLVAPYLSMPIFTYLLTIVNLQVILEVMMIVETLKKLNKIVADQTNLFNFNQINLFWDKT